MEKTSPQKWIITEIKMYSAGPIIHLNKLKEQLLGDGLGEDVVYAKIMHQCIKVLKTKITWRGPLMVIT